MVEFTHPHFLWLVLLVPPLVWWWLRRPRRALPHPLAARLALPASRRAWLARWGGVGLRGLALLLLVVALAGPRWPDLRTRIDTEGIAILMLVDVSGSMAEPDFDWNGEPISRLEAVKRVFHLFVEGPRNPGSTPDGGDQSGFQGRPTDQIGLVAFATRPESVCPLTLIHSALLRLLDEQQPKRNPDESQTNISDAIVLGLHRLQAAGPRRKVMVLLTDGEHNVPRPQSGWMPREEARVAAGLEVPIYTLDAGGATPGNEAPVRDSSSAEVRTTRNEAVHVLEEIARITGGRMFSARDTASLLQACRSIDQLERTRVQSFLYRRYYDGYPWFALTSFVFLVSALALDMTFWRRLP